MWSGFLKLILGMALALVLLIAGGSAISWLLMSRLIGSPPKPEFENDHPLSKNQPTPVVLVSPTPVKPTQATVTPTPSPQPGAFSARISWPQGVTVRDRPATDGSRVTGVDFNAQVTVLENSADGIWQRIRLENGREGWIKAGNLEPLATNRPQR
ncbi:hypothetical protein DO97_20870 [Neosynechococcus sphagnicola sy1]|uniref:SH3b domain-containing protein n=1 Tax=Neosynechococcus sphagnicola sy1 TaxID=1497020 RepID=A0A098TR59_9CYAN|nr:SH3 domain-containing protein [Neosynechococcus sphagnicola]KGF73288.1 hypothetical protein DO97_20870 [Neosynechococcus sphagnicola sy1]